jgi:RNA polymerase sigma-70 factor (ECF subfamily)
MRLPRTDQGSEDESSADHVKSNQFVFCVLIPDAEFGILSAATQPIPDSTLIERMMAGDEAALSIVYDRYSAMLFGMLMRILDERGAAEEVLQDLFLQLWHNAGRFDAARGSLPAWLLVMGRNRALSRLRGRGRHEVTEEEDGAYANVFVSSQNLEEEAVRAELMRSVGAALSSLAPEQRQAVELAYFEGMTQSEIATRTGAPLGTVKTRVRAAMQTLRQVLSEN